MPYKSNGFPIGRPRRGEIRPETDAAKRAREWSRRARKNPAYRRAAVMYIQLLRLAFPKHMKVIEDGVLARKKSWEKARGKVGRVLI